MTTTIRISDKIWKRLNKRKANPRESFDDVLKRILDSLDKKNES